MPVIHVQRAIASSKHSVDYLRQSCTADPFFPIALSSPLAPRSGSHTRTGQGISACARVPKEAVPAQMNRCHFPTDTTGSDQCDLPYHPIAFLSFVVVIVWPLSAVGC